MVIFSELTDISVYVYPRITRKQSNCYESRAFVKMLAVTAWNMLLTNHLSSDWILSIDVLTRFEFAVFRFGIIMTANLAAHHQPLGRSFCHKRLAHGHYIIAWSGFKPML